MKLLKQSTCLLLTATAALFTLPGNATAATFFDGPSVADIGVGFIATNSGAARWDLHVHDETNDLELEPDEAIFVVNETGFGLSPGGLLAPILGPTGTPFWRLPSPQNLSLLYLGVGAEEVETNLFVGDLVNLTLTAVSGPGEFSMYTVDGFGNPTAYFNTRDGISGADVRQLTAGDHAHYNFAFSAPGTYTVTLRASGTLIAGAEFTESDPVDYTFVVVPEPSTYALFAGGAAALAAWNVRRRMRK
jgi:surface-anchored protein